MRIRDKEVNYFKESKGYIESGDQSMVARLLKFRQLFPENKLPVGLGQFKIEILVDRA